MSALARAMFESSTDARTHVPARPPVWRFAKLCTASLPALSLRRPSSLLLFTARRTSGTWWWMDAARLTFPLELARLAVSAVPARVRTAIVSCRRAPAAPTEPACGAPDKTRSPSRPATCRRDHRARSADQTAADSWGAGVSHGSSCRFLAIALGGSDFGSTCAWRRGRLAVLMPADVGHPPVAERCSGSSQPGRRRGADQSALFVRERESRPGTDGAGVGRHLPRAAGWSAVCTRRSSVTLDQRLRFRVRLVVVLRDRTHRMAPDKIGRRGWDQCSESRRDQAL